MKEKPVNKIDDIAHESDNLFCGPYNHHHRRRHIASSHKNNNKWSSIQAH